MKPRNWCTGGSDGSEMFRSGDTGTSGEGGGGFEGSRRFRWGIRLGGVDGTRPNRPKVSSLIMRGDD